MPSHNAKPPGPGKGRKRKNPNDIGVKTLSRMGTTSQKTNLKVDHLLSDLPKEDYEHFFEMARRKKRYADLQAWLKEKTGETVSIHGIGKWYHHNFPVGKEAKFINEIGATFSGADAEKVLSMLLVQAAKLFSTGMNSLEKEAPNVEPNQWLGILPSYAREIRGAANELSNIKYHDVGEAELAGAQRACDLLMTIFVDTPFEAGLREAVRGVMKQVESESK